MTSRRDPRDHVIALACATMSDFVDYERTDRPSTAQPPPVHIPGAVSVHDILIERIRERAQFGLRKYGTPLQVDNGRDPLCDALEELIDACAYLCQEIERRERSARVVEAALDAAMAPTRAG